MKNLILISFIFTLFTSCAHHRDVRRGASGINWVEIKAESKESGTKNAISQANHFCEQYEKSAAFISEQKSYTGSMKESDYRTTKNIGKAAQMIGGTMFGAGHGTNHHVTGNAGGLLGLGGSVASEMAGKGYTINMKFKCL